MAVIFKEDGHIYQSLDENLEKDKINWTSVTTFISKFKPEFNQKAIAKKSSKNKRSKWFGLKPEEVIDIWKKETERAIGLGNWYHNQRESDMLVEVVNGKVNITDYKTNKEIKDKGYVNWEGISSKMFKPLNNLEDCNLNHYNVQLSLYMYIILKHNPKLKAGKLTIQHVSFKKDKDDAYGYPISSKDSNGDPIIKDIKMYDMPYLKDEVRSLIMELKDNPLC